MNTSNPPESIEFMDECAPTPSHDDSTTVLAASESAAHNQSQHKASYAKDRTLELDELWTAKPTIWEQLKDRTSRTRMVRKGVGVATALAISACSPIAAAEHFQPIGDSISVSIWEPQPGDIYERSGTKAVHETDTEERMGVLVLPGYGERDPFEAAEELVSENKERPFLPPGTPIASVSPPTDGFEISKLRKDIVLFCEEFNVKRVIVVGISAGTLWGLEALEGTDIIIDTLVPVTSPSRAATAYDGENVARMATISNLPEQLRDKTDLLVGRLGEAAFLGLRQGHTTTESLLQFAINETQTGASPELFVSENLILANSTIVSQPKLLKKNLVPGSRIIYARPKDAATDDVVDIVRAESEYRQLAHALGIPFTELELDEPGHAKERATAQALASLFRFEQRQRESRERHDPDNRKFVSSTDSAA